MLWMRCDAYNAKMEINQITLGEGHVLEIFRQRPQVWDVLSPTLLSSFLFPTFSLGTSIALLFWWLRD